MRASCNSTADKGPHMTHEEGEPRRRTRLQNLTARPTPNTSRLPNNPWRDGSDLSAGDPHTSGDCSTRPNRTVAHVGEDAETDAVLIPSPSGLEQLTRASIGMGSIATCSSMRAESGGA